MTARAWPSTEAFTTVVPGGATAVAAASTTTFTDTDAGGSTANHRNARIDSTRTATVPGTRA